jgi:hypothetical protein
MLFLDGVYADNKHGTSGFHRLKAPTNDELTQLTHTIAHRVGRYLERQGLLVRDSDQSYFTADAVEKVRPGTGREAGLGYAQHQERVPWGMCALRAPPKHWISVTAPVRAVTLVKPALRVRCVAIAR